MSRQWWAKIIWIFSKILITTVIFKIIMWLHFYDIITKIYIFYLSICITNICIFCGQDTLSNFLPSSAMF